MADKAYMTSMNDLAALRSDFIRGHGVDERITYT